MKRLSFILLACVVLFVGCVASVPVTFENKSDYDIPLRIEGYWDTTYLFTVNKHTSVIMGINKLYADIQVVGSFPVTVSYSGSHNVLIVPYKTSKLNIRNATNQYITFTVKNEYKQDPISVSANSDLSTTFYGDKLNIICDYQFFGISENNGEFILIFY